MKHFGSKYRLNNLKYIIKQCMFWSYDSLQLIDKVYICNNDHMNKQINKKKKDRNIFTQKNNIGYKCFIFKKEKIINS